MPILTNNSTYLSFNSYSNAINYNGAYSTNTSSVPTSWESLGPAPISNVEGGFSWGTPPLSGRVTSLTVNGSNPSIVYLGSAGGGIWKSIDNGTHWVPLTDNQSSLSTGIVTLSPDNATIYAGTGEANHKADNNPGEGLLRSFNGGMSWQLLGANYFNGSAISGIVINKSNQNDIIVSTTWAMCCRLTTKTQNPNGLGVFVSHDNGYTWHQTLNPSDGQGIASLRLDPNNNSIVYAGSYSSSVYISTNGGENWNEKVFYTQPSQQGRTFIAVQKNEKNLIYVASINATGNVNSIFQYNTTTNTNKTMAVLPSAPYDGQAYGPCASHCQYSAFFEVDPINASIIYFGGIDVYRTTNGGLSWTDLGGSIAGSLIHPDQHALAFDPTNTSIIYNGNDGGLWKSYNRGTLWINENSNLSITQFDSVAVSPNNPNEYIGGTQDNGCNKYSGSYSWTGIAVADGGWTGFETTNSSVMYCFYAYLNLQNTLDGGKTWNYVPIASELSLFYVPVVQDKQNPGTLYAAGIGIFKSTDYGQTWSNIASSVSGNIITALAIDPTNNRILIAGDQAGGIFRSTNGGINWNNVFNDTGPNSVTSLAIDPTNGMRMYASFASFSSAILYLSANGGLTWTKDATNGLPDRGINVIKIRPIDGSIYVGTDAGVFYSLSQTSNWLLTGLNLPNAVIWDLAFDGNASLVAASFGRGVWRLQNLPTPQVPKSTSSSTTSTASISSSNTSSKKLPSFEGLFLIITFVAIILRRKKKNT